MLGFSREHMIITHAGMFADVPPVMKRQIEAFVNDAVQKKDRLYSLFREAQGEVLAEMMRNQQHLGELYNSLVRLTSPESCTPLIFNNTPGLFSKKLQNIIRGVGSREVFYLAKRILDNWKSHLPEAMGIVSGFRPRRRFEVDLEGWKYESRVFALVEKNRREGNNYRNRCIESPVLVAVIPEETSSSCGFEGARHILNFGLNHPQIKYVVHHELEHLCQYLMSMLISGRRDKVDFGLGPKKNRNPGVSQHERIEGDPYSLEHFDKKDTKHMLDDIEQYPRLIGVVYQLFRAFGWGLREDGSEGTKSEPGTPKSRMSILKAVLDEKTTHGSVRKIRDNFKKLVRNNPGKAEKALNELMRCYVYLEGIESMTLPDNPLRGFDTQYFLDKWGPGPKKKTKKKRARK